MSISSPSLNFFGSVSCCHQLALLPKAAGYWTIADSFQQIPWGQGYLHWASSGSGQINTSPENKAFPESCQTGWRETILWGWRFWGNSTSFLPPLVHIRLLVYNSCAGCKTTHFQCCYGTWRMGEGQAKTPKLTVLSKIQLFFLNKYSSNFRVTLVNFQVSEKVDFDNPYQYFHCFYGRV